MKTETIRFYNFPYSKIQTYGIASLFILGNIVLPQLFHLIPQGGIAWLPIYFFTLIGAYKYGWKAGLLTAVLSPLLNSWMFGMPPVTGLPVILFKSILLAVAAGFTAHRCQKVSILLITLVVACYQIAGTLGEWAMKGDFYLSVQDFRIGIPGMLLQIFGGYLFIKHLIRK